MYPDNLEECLNYVVECAGNLKEYVQSKGHSVTFEKAMAIAVAQLQEDTANWRCRKELV